MNLKRASCQTGESLTEFYSELATHDGWTCVCEMMLQLLPKLEGLADEVPIWGLTSHERLVLLATDDYRTPWFVMITPHRWEEYDIHYLLPKAEAPWGGARVEGIARDLDQASRMIRIAMQRSGGCRERVSSHSVIRIAAARHPASVL